MIHITLSGDKVNTELNDSDFSKSQSEDLTSMSYVIEACIAGLAPDHWPDHLVFETASEDGEPLHTYSCSLKNFEYRGREVRLAKYAMTRRDAPHGRVHLELVIVSNL